jgi:O-antigen/teichoic acid export membrane protein
MDNLIYIFFNKDAKKLFYNIKILYNFCQKNNLNLICITYKEYRNIALKIKENYNLTFYLLEDKKEIRKLKIEGNNIIIYNNINKNIHNIYRKRKFKDGFIGLIRENFIIFHLINPYIIFGKNVRIYENFLLTYLGNKKFYIDQKYKINKFFLEELFINLIIYYDKIIKTFNKIMNLKYFEDYIHEKIGLITYKAITFLLLVILARILTDTFYGAYVSIYNFLGLIAGIIGSSNIILTKYLSEYKDNKYIKIDIYLKIIFSIFILLIIFLFPNYFLSTTFYGYSFLDILIIYITAILLSLIGVYFSIFYSQLNIKSAKNLYILESLLKFIFIVSLSVIIKNVGFIFGLFLTYFVLSFVYLYKLKKNKINFVSILKEKINFNDFKKYIKSTILISLPVTLLGLYSSIDIQILRTFTGYATVGEFYSALIIVYTLSGIFTINNITLPRILRWEKEKVIRNINRLLLIQFLINIILTGLLILIGPYIIIFIFGKNYQLSANIIKYLSIILIISSFNIYTLILYRKDMEKYYPIYAITTALISIITDIILISNFKLSGAIASAILANVYIGLISYIIYETKFHNIPSRSIFRYNYKENRYK